MNSLRVRQNPAQRARSCPAGWPVTNSCDEFSLWPTTHTDGHTHRSRLALGDFFMHQRHLPIILASNRPQSRGPNTGSSKARSWFKHGRRRTRRPSGKKNDLIQNGCSRECLRARTYRKVFIFCYSASLLLYERALLAGLELIFGLDAS